MTLAWAITATLIALLAVLWSAYESHRADEATALARHLWGVVTRPGVGRVP